MAARYRKIYLSMWGDEKFCRLSPLKPSGQALWIYLLTAPETTKIPGLIRIGEAALAEILGWSSVALVDALAELSRQGLVHVCRRHRIVWIPGAIRYNKPESINVVLSWENDINNAPECDIITQAIQTLRDNISGAFWKAFAKASRMAKVMPSGMAKVMPKPLPKTESSQLNQVVAGQWEKSSAVLLDENGQRQVVDDQAQNYLTPVSVRNDGEIAHLTLVKRSCTAPVTQDELSARNDSEIPEDGAAAVVSIHEAAQKRRKTRKNEDKKKSRTKKEEKLERKESRNPPIVPPGASKEDREHGKMEDCGMITPPIPRDTPPDTKPCSRCGCVSDAQAPRCLCAECHGQRPDSVTPKRERKVSAAKPWRRRPEPKRQASPSWFGVFAAQYEIYAESKLPRDSVGILEPAVTRLGEADALARWVYHLETQDLKFAGVKNFAGRLAAWRPPPGWEPTGTNRHGKATAGKNGDDAERWRERAKARIAEKKRISEKKRSGVA